MRRRMLLGLVTALLLSRSDTASSAVGAAKIDGVLDDAVYAQVAPLESDISVLRLVPVKDGLYIGVEVDDPDPSLANPEEFWSHSCVEVWFDWGNDDSIAFDENDQQFWLMPVGGAAGGAYVGQWHRAEDNIAATVFDYAGVSDLVEAAFVLDEGVGYTVEVYIDGTLLGGYTPSGTIGFTYSVGKDGAKVQWEDADLADGFWERPDTWPDLAIEEAQAVQANGKATLAWASLKSPR